MRKILPLLFAISMFASCGPHRMGCGARGICRNPQQLESMQPEKSLPIKDVG